MTSPYKRPTHSRTERQLHWLEELPVKPAYSLGSERPDSTPDRRPLLPGQRAGQQRPLQEQRLSTKGGTAEATDFRPF